VSDLLPYLMAAHVVGDFCLQNDWMSSRKASLHHVCLIHVAAYSLPFLLLIPRGLELLPLLAILGQHYAQDRYGLHLRWMRFYGQTPPERWSVGPLCVDQAMHIGWIALVCGVLP
jgi:hypothetical protein